MSKGMLRSRNTKLPFESPPHALEYISIEVWRGGGVYSPSPPSPPLFNGSASDIFFGPPLSLPELTFGDLRRKLRRLPVLVLLAVEARRLGPVLVDILASSSSSSSSSLRRFSEIRSGGDPTAVALGDVFSSSVCAVDDSFCADVGVPVARISMSSSSASSSG
jgi:hypothetical protein